MLLFAFIHAKNFAVELYFVLFQNCSSLFYFIVKIYIFDQKPFQKRVIFLNFFILENNDWELNR